ncbi:AER059Cp [Eremothecium gossypii ATCC 10895]|uniref:Arrestin-related trafficking adapter 10 n=1 Tax=Eremothecium gossypii (strain ATCC 10895 / CBS 109.51 / FGSC 9923 / NRRL Y-1056) TaxID=284811 RepID=ART10_EREGS|nr:AER059Cp [Eremothecium gossypii ATCC 10895]Q757F4.1 RecName: Full=Arrestin-related trafficking adapter 10 [Eremothecium gossypii ATCC 10895]AAS52743.1 AER059Cp [Eremothecium gossypii ATCC 10895]AEY97049.1 FAER059Cp [Eremothecium gossypii FDAG1]
MTTKITLKLNPPHNGRYYTEDDIISGSVVLKLAKATAVKQLRVILKGTSQTMTLAEADRHSSRLPQDPQTQYTKEKSTHILFHQGVQLLPPTGVEDSIKLGQDTYKYGFEFRLAGGPKCVSGHQATSHSFLEDKAHEHYGEQLPPSFNDRHEGGGVTTEELFFYNLGKVRYTVRAEADVATGNKWAPKSPLHDTMVISFLPLQCQAYVENACTSAGSDDTLVNYTALPRTYRAAADVVLSDGLSVTPEVRSNALAYVHRLDYLFRESSGKFGNIFMVFSGDPTKHSVKLTRLVLSLHEKVSFTANGHTNKNLSQLKLMDTPLDDELQLRDLHILEDGSREGKLNLGDHPVLSRLRFNEEDYIHRGNTLFSFTTCNIKREYYFQLDLHWKVDATAVRSEIIVDPVTVYAESAPPAFEGLPPYPEKPPKYEA